MALLAHIMLRANDFRFVRMTIIVAQSKGSIEERDEFPFLFISSLTIHHPTDFSQTQASSSLKLQHFEQPLHSYARVRIHPADNSALCQPRLRLTSRRPRRVLRNFIERNDK